jgi:hypothetical protein
VPPTSEQITPSDAETNDSPAGHAQVPSGAGTRGGTVADQDTEGSATVPHPDAEQLRERQQAGARRRLRRRIGRPAEPSDVDIIAERIAREQRDV